jgi:protein involved in polysaccharide export with SLBB domain
LSQRPQVDQALQGTRPPAILAAENCARYIIHCPDVLEIHVEGRNGLSGERKVPSDGNVECDGQSVRVDGLTPNEVVDAIARQQGLPVKSVTVRVTGYNSQCVYLFGEISGLPRVVPYQGPESVVDLLRRVGGITQGAALDEIQVVRSHVADGKAPEVFRVDLKGILVRNDPQTNLWLEPSDQIYIGQSRSSRLCCCVPPWLRPFYHRLCGLNDAPN